jgi:hypothetical protein
MDLRIYVNGEYFEQCKYLLLSIPKESVKNFDKIESIDEAAELLDRSMEGCEFYDSKISPETEFWGHCSNLQVWIENQYDTRLLHSNLAFPLLKELFYAGDPIAKEVFKKEVTKRLLTGYPSVVNYILEEGYFNDFSREEKDTLADELAEKISTARSIEELNNYFVSFYNSYFEILSPIAKVKICENFFKNKYLENEKVNSRSLFYGLSDKEKDDVFNLIKPKIFNLTSIKTQLLDYKTFSDHGIEQARRNLRKIVLKIILKNTNDLIKFIID